jgi:hypothetical protein
MNIVPLFGCNTADTPSVRFASPFGEGFGFEISLSYDCISVKGPVKHKT